jgi:hypothetical protein
LKSQEDNIPNQAQWEPRTELVRRPAPIFFGQSGEARFSRVAIPIDFVPALVDFDHFDPFFLIGPFNHIFLSAA